MTSRSKLIKLGSLISATLFLLPLTTFAQSDTLINIPQLSGGGFNGYINAVYAMFISIAALLAVVKIIVAGVKYMFSDVVTQKSDAKKDIQGALLGLLVVLAAVLILTVINPDLTNFNVNGVANNQIAAQTPTTRTTTVTDVCASQGLTCATDTNSASQSTVVSGDGLTPSQMSAVVDSCGGGSQVSIQTNSFTQSNGAVDSISCVNTTDTEVTRLQSALSTNGVTNAANLIGPIFIDEYTRVVAPYAIETSTLNDPNPGTILFAADFTNVRGNASINNFDSICTSRLPGVNTISDVGLDANGMPSIRICRVATGG